MNNIQLFFRIIVPPTLCVLFLYFIVNDLFYYPLSFGLIIGLFNWDLHKHKPILGILLSVLVSYASFFIAYFSLGLYGFIQSFVLEKMSIVIGEGLIQEIGFIISPHIIAPLLVFFGYKYIFNILKTKLAIYIIIFSIMLLVIYVFFLFRQVDSVTTDYLNQNKMLRPFIFWQLIMALALQLLIYQKDILEIKAETKPNTKNHEN